MVGEDVLKGRAMSKGIAERIHEVLQGLDGVDEKLLTSAEALFLPTILEDEELPELAAKTGGSDFVVATDRRILRVELFFNGTPRRHRSFSYEEILGV